jgi:hypothetical protein
VQFDAPSDVVGEQQDRREGGEEHGRLGKGGEDEDGRMGRGSKHSGRKKQGKGVAQKSRGQR